MTLSTLLTQRLNLQAPIILAPMAGVAGGALAAAVSRAGGLGMIGGGYGDPAWVEREWAAADGADVGIGFVTWKISPTSDVFLRALSRKPKAVMLSFGDIAPFADAIHASGALLIAQVQTVADARFATASGADIIVAQGTEAGGHGGTRATMPLVPAVVDAVGDIPVVAAGGIADGRGLAASLMLGASGVLCGSAFYTATEALTHEKAKAAALAASGDDTVQSHIFDVMRGHDWPRRWLIRSLRNHFLESWLDRVDSLPEALATESQPFADALAKGDFSIAPVIVGEAADLLRKTVPAETVMQNIMDQAEAQLTAPSWRVS